MDNDQEISFGYVGWVDNWYREFQECQILDDIGREYDPQKISISGGMDGSYPLSKEGWKRHGKIQISHFLLLF